MRPNDTTDCDIEFTAEITAYSVHHDTWQWKIGYTTTDGNADNRTGIDTVATILSQTYNHLGYGLPSGETITVFGWVWEYPFPDPPLMPSGSYKDNSWHCP